VREKRVEGKSAMEPAQLPRSAGTRLVQSAPRTASCGMWFSECSQGCLRTWIFIGHHVPYMPPWPRLVRSAPGTASCDIMMRYSE